jgi:hypothetical protein
VRFTCCGRRRVTRCGSAPRIATAWGPGGARWNDSKPLRLLRSSSLGSDKVFDGLYNVRSFGAFGRMYDVSADGQRFLVIKETPGADESPPSARIILVQNWFEELKRLVPTK